MPDALAAGNPWRLEYGVRRKADSYPTARRRPAPVTNAYDTSCHLSRYHAQGILSWTYDPSVDACRHLAITIHLPKAHAEEETESAFVIAETIAFCVHDESKIAVGFEPADLNR